jgi:nucleoside-diphosphate-sugar epimerase
MPRVLIAGCGYVGAATADLFHGAKWDVEGWTRSQESAEVFAGKPYAVRAVDISDRNVVQSVAGECDAVIHCASSGGGGAESYQRVYFAGAQNLLAVLHPRIFIFTSSTSVYAQTSGEWVDEESPAKPLPATGRILRATEELVRRASGVVARLAGIYGPGRSAMLRKFLSGEARIEGDGERILNQVHRDDVAAALFLLATWPNEKPASVFNVADDQPITQRECYEWLAAKLDRPLPETTHSAGTRKRGTSNKRVRNRKLRELGWVPRFPTFQVGMEMSVLPALPALGA